MSPVPYPAPAAEAAAGPEPPPAAADVPPSRRLTLRQERFCQAFVVCPNAADAAREAGYSEASARKQGWRLLRTERVRARLQEIQTGLAADLMDSVDSLIGKLEVVYRLAVEDRRTLAAVRAVELQGRFTQLKRRLPPAAEEAAALFRAEVERRQAMGRALARRRWPAAGDNRRPDDAETFNSDNCEPQAEADKCVQMRTAADSFQIPRRLIAGAARIVAPFHRPPNAARSHGGAAPPGGRGT